MAINNSTPQTAGRCPPQELAWLGDLSRSLGSRCGQLRASAKVLEAQLRIQNVFFLGVEDGHFQLVYVKKTWVDLVVLVVSVVKGGDGNTQKWGSVR